MSYNKFATLPALTLKPSKYLKAYLPGIHLLPLVLLLQPVALGLMLRVIMLALLIVSFYYYWFNYLPGHNALKTLRLRSDGIWVLEYEKYSKLASLKTNSFISGWLLILRFKTGNRKVLHQLILPDMLDRNNYRRLRLVLLMNVADPARSGNS